MFDRLSTHPTPSASPPLGSRASPVPRRPNQLGSSLARPPFNVRSSSLSLASRASSSNGSLPGTSRAANGSMLKQEISVPAPSEDPLDVLERIVGRPRPKERDASGDEFAISKPDRMVSDIHFGGLSLQDFAHRKGASQDQRQDEIKQLNTQSVEEYEKESGKFEDLHRSIQACDNVLKSVEVSLAGFQKDLGVVSTEIETLQNRSTTLNNRLENRRSVEKLLSPAVEEVSIPPNVVSTISDGQVDKSFLKALAELQRKLGVVEEKSQDPGSIKAVEDVKPLLENLKNKALGRARDYIVTQIKAIRSPNMNAQIIQQQRLVKYKDLYAFLAKHHPQLADEISQAYVHTMRWYYLSHFTRYRDALDKLTLVRFDQPDLIGAEPAPRTARTHSNTPPGVNAFALGHRADILLPAADTALPSYVAEEDRTPRFPETPFHSLTLALIDNVAAEYAFQTDFFAHPPTSTHSAASRRCAALFEPTFALARTFITDLVAGSSRDALGLLLCVRLAQRAQFALQRRRCPAADAYVNGALLALWPRVQQAVDAHAESVRAAAAAVSLSRGAASRLAATASMSTAADAARQSAAPHPLTQRFAQLLRGILDVSKESGDDEPVASSLGRLRSEYEGFLQKASKGAGAEPRKRDRFLANNYALVLTIMGDAEGKLAVEQHAVFERLSGEVSGRASGR